MSRCEHWLRGVLNLVCESCSMVDKILGLTRFDSAARTGEKSVFSHTDKFRSAGHTIPSWHIQPTKSIESKWEWMIGNCGAKVFEPATENKSRAGNYYPLSSTCGVTSGAT